MSIMIEVWLRSPHDPQRANALNECASRFGGQTTFLELEVKSTCYTIEFADWDSANRAVVPLQELADHIEGPMEYGKE